MNVPKLRFKNDDGSEFSSREEKHIGDVIDNFGGTALEEFVSSQGTHHFISIGNYEKTGKYFDNGQRISLNDKTKQKLLNKGDLVMVLNDKTQAGDLIGATILIEEDNKYIYNQRSERLKCRDKIIFPEFAWHLFNSYKFRKEVFSISQGGTQIYVNFPAIKKLIISVPDIKEQTKIANFLSAVDEKITQLTQKHELLNKYKKGVMQKIFSQELRFKDDNGSEFPEWNISRISEIFLRSSHSSKTEFIEQDGKYYIVDMGSIGRDAALIVTKKTNHTSDFLTTNDLVMAKDDIGGGNIIGKVVRIPANNKYICGDHVFKLSLRKEDDCVGYYYYAINSYEINKSFRKKANGTAQLGISNNTVDEQLISVPSLNEKIKIANFLTAIDDKITATQSQLELVKQYKQGLLQQMFV